MNEKRIPIGVKCADAVKSGVHGGTGKRKNVILRRS